MQFYVRCVIMTGHRLLNTAELRLGRHSVEDIMTHRFFKGMKWDNLHNS